MSRSEHCIKIDKLVLIFNDRYPAATNKKQLKRACQRIGIDIYNVRSNAPQGGRPSIAIMSRDVPRLEAEMKSRMPVHAGHDTGILRRLKEVGITPAKMARLSGINEGTLSQIKHGKKTMTRGQLAKLKIVLKEVEG